MKRLIITICCLGGLAATNIGWAGLSQLSISYYSDYGATVYAQSYGHSTYATAFSANLVGGAALPVPHTDPFVTFCMDINMTLANGWWTSGGFSDVSLTSQTTPAQRQSDGLYRAASLYQHYAGAVGHATGLPAGNPSGWVWDSKLQGAALQLAIWEVLYEKGGMGYSIDQNDAIANTAEFYVSSVNASVRSLANTMLLSEWNVVDLNLGTTFWNAQGSSQDLIGPMAPVPEPTTILAGALLLLPFGASTVRFLRKNRTA